MVGNQTNVDPNAEQPAGGQDYAKWAAGLGAMGTAALIGLGPGGRSIRSSLFKHFPEWAAQLHALPGVGVLSSPSAMHDAEGLTSVYMPRNFSPTFMRELDRIKNPNIPALGDLPAVQMRFSPHTFGQIEQEQPQGLSTLAHELIHGQGGMEQLSRYGESGWPETTGEGKMYSQIFERLYPKPQEHMDALMDALSQPEIFGDIPKMYQSYRSRGENEKHALGEAITEILARKRMMDTFPDLNPKRLQEKWKVRGGGYIDPLEFNDVVGKEAQRLKPPGAP